VYLHSLKLLWGRELQCSPIGAKAVLSVQSILRLSTLLDRSLKDQTRPRGGLPMFACFEAPVHSLVLFCKLARGFGLLCSLLLRCGFITRDQWQRSRALLNGRSPVKSGLRHQKELQLWAFCRIVRRLRHGTHRFYCNHHLQLKTVRREIWRYRVQRFLSAVRLNTAVQNDLQAAFRTDPAPRCVSEC
jgi:hypothetical protein